MLGITMKFINVLFALITLFGFLVCLHHNWLGIAIFELIASLICALRTNDGNPPLYEQLCEYLNQ